MDDSSPEGTAGACSDRITSAWDDKVFQHMVKQIIDPQTVDQNAQAIHPVSRTKFLEKVVKGQDGWPRSCVSTTDSRLYNTTAFDVIKTTD